MSDYQAVRDERKKQEKDREKAAKKQAKDQEKTAK
jgi:hypothetical protein